jgi:23S rRNA (guanosine2251-2'-O)-methyltransferase
MKEWITGRNPVYEVLRAKRRQAFRLRIASGAVPKGRLEEIIQTVTRYKLPVERVSREQIDSLGDNPQGVALEVSAYPYHNFDDILVSAQKKGEPLFILLLDLVQNPQNLGTLLRTAEAVGVHGVVIPLARAAGVTPAVVSASAGASEHMLVAQANLAQVIDELKKRDTWVIGLEGGPGARLPEEVRLDGALALVVGNEGDGMRPLVRQKCDLLMRLPMQGKIESLNAAVAGSVALYLAAQARAIKTAPV